MAQQITSHVLDSTQLCLLCFTMAFQQGLCGFFVAAIAIVVVAQKPDSKPADFQVECKRGSVLVVWTVGPELAPNASRLMLGSCMPNLFHPHPNGGGQAIYHYRFKDCGFKEELTSDQIIYKSKLGFRPKPKPEPYVFSYPIECVYRRKKTYMAPFLHPGYADIEAYSQLTFNMMLLNDDLNGPAQSNSFPVGSFIPIWAAVGQKGHQPLVLLMDECVASSSMTLEPNSQVYPIITNHGCLDDGKRAHSQFLPRYQSSEVVLYLQAFQLGVKDQEVYIHCKLEAWDPKAINEGNKMCNFNKQLGGWELLDDSSKSAICSCCDSVCKRRGKRDTNSDAGVIQNAVLDFKTYESVPARNAVLSLNMATLLTLVVLVLVAGVAHAKVDFTVDCGKDTVTVLWPMALPNEPNIEPENVRLGYCTPTSVHTMPGGAQAVFSFKEWRCGAEMMALQDVIVWSTELTHISELGDDHLLSKVHCVDERTPDWTPQSFKPVIETFGSGQLLFSMNLMNEDFSGPSLTTVYRLGDRIPIAASVEQASHQPLLLLLEECVATSDIELEPDTLSHTFISNKGCFDDSKESMSSFQPRQSINEMRLYLQAFAFAVDMEVYLHCKLVAWEDGNFSPSKKACHYKNESWELLDDPSNSSVCRCCDSSCKGRRRRELGGGVTKNLKVGPLIIKSGLKS
ncbi:uncharacterized protein LOC134464838 [Engraulis encrasicolus]|uniref:uncharacterized protein LOC134464838 n=1 Tax=Engraulis encrasicolus TaxID=184585 RepID=UPI002FD05138